MKLLNKSQKVLNPCEISINTNKTNFFIPKFDKNLGCYRLPPLKGILSPRFGEARRKERFGLPRWATTLKRNFCR
jgi:hypothetical protein